MQEGEESARLEPLEEAPECYTYKAPLEQLEAMPPVRAARVKPSGGTLRKHQRVEGGNPFPN